MTRPYSTEPALDMEAAEWVVRLEDPDFNAADAALQAQFFAWLQRSPQHLQAFMDARDTFRQLDRLDSRHRIDVPGLLANRSAEVIPLHGAMENMRPSAPARTAVTERASPPRRLRIKMAAAAACIAVGVTLAAMVLHGFGAPVYATAFGEQRSFKLDDGSTLYLNTSSRAEVRFSKRAREIRLLQGEALFSVEHDATRPFLVSTDRATVQAIGTQFNVYRRQGLTRVTVVEGVVEVVGSGVSLVHGKAESPQAARAATHTRAANEAGIAPAATRIVAGEEARITDGGVMKQTVKDVNGAVAWRERRLVFRNAPLAEVAAEFNRYNKAQIQLVGETVRRKQLTGIFSADHPQSIILYLGRDESLTVQPAGDAWVIRAR